MNLKNQKRSLRRQVVARILAMDPDDRNAQETELTRRFDELPGLMGAQTVLLYASAFPEEFETRRILEKTLQRGKQLVLPRVDRPGQTLQLFAVTDLDRDLETGHKDIPEPSLVCPRVDPEVIDWALVPGLAFNSQGFRLGRGAGHYDRLLPMLRREVPRWALILDSQWLEDLPIEPHDQPIDGVADHHQIIHCLQARA